MSYMNASLPKEPARSILRQLFKITMDNAFYYYVRGLERYTV